jgi:hypothetical protein
MKMRKNLLIDLLMKDNPSGSEDVISPMVIEELTKLGFTVNMDDIGNISAVRGVANRYPLLNAHLDQVDYSGDWYSGSYYNLNSNYLAYDHDLYNAVEGFVDDLSIEELDQYFTCKNCSVIFKGCKDSTLNKICSKFVLKFGDYALAKKIAINEYGLDFTTYGKKVEKEVFKITETKEGKLIGNGGRVLGGDDKAGIFIALEVARLNRKQPMKILFTVSEEVGCVGIRHFIKNNLEWFDDVAYSITIDRRSGDNLLWSQCGTRSCSDMFAGRMALAGTSVGIPIKIQDGSVADVVEIRDIVDEAVNVSAGYYEPHSEEEYVLLNDVKKIIQWLRLFLKEEIINE